MLNASICSQLRVNLVFLLFGAYSTVYQMYVHCCCEREGTKTLKLQAVGLTHSDLIH